MCADLFKNTPSTHEDKEKLEQAIECLKGVMAYVLLNICFLCRYVSVFLLYFVG